MISAQSVACYINTLVLNLQFLNSELHSSSQLRQQNTQQHSQQATQHIVKQNTQTPATAQASADSCRSIATKNTDRHYKEDRKFNFVIHGIKECCKGTPKYERLKHDLKEVTSVIMNTESSISPLSIRDHLLLGKYRENSKRPRPVLVKFNRAIDKSLLLSNLRATTLSGNIKITPDLSVEERTTRTLLLIERWHLMQDGTEREIRFNKILVATKVHG